MGRAWQDGRRGYLAPHTIRRSLTEGSIPASHKLARFVGSESYAAAGGVVMRDLFDEGNAGLFTDGTLLMRLATEKLDGLVEEERGAGWKWVKAELENDYGPYYPSVSAMGFDESDDEEEQGTEPSDAGFTDEEKARSGVRIRIGQDGTPVIERGLVHPDDQPRAAPLSTKAKPDPTKGEYPSPWCRTSRPTAPLLCGLR